MRFFSYILLFLGLFLSFAQSIPEKGMPFIQNYLPQDYGNHGKIWEIKSSNNGLIYMASDNGLLEFDGQNWNRYRDYRGYTRSLCLANDSTIYIGADMDFGVWKRNRIQKFSYTSLYPYSKKIGGVNEEFWGTYQLKNKIVFVSHQNIYLLSNGKISKISAPTRFTDSFQEGNKIYLADEKKGFYEFDGSHLKLLFQNSFEISSIFRNKELLFLVTKNQGIFTLSHDGNLLPFQSEISSEIIKNKVFSFTKIDEKYLAFGTILNGVYITDLNGKILRHINKDNGLPNNTVLSLHYQKNGKLWLGLDYGISSVNIQSNIAYFLNNYNDFGTGYAAALKDDIFYLGTNQGLYTANWTELNHKEGKIFSILNGSEGQVWTLQNIDGKILCGHDKGLYEANENGLTKIYGESGVMCLLKYNEDYLFAGSYNGISVFKKEGNSWKFTKKIPLILGAVNQIIQENKEVFWANIPNYGLIRFSLSSNFAPTNRQIFDAKTFKGYFPQVFKDQSGIHVITNSLQYYYNSTKKKFEEEKNSSKNFEVKNLLPGFYRPLNFAGGYSFYSVNNGFALENLQGATALSYSPKLIFRKAEAFDNDKDLAFFANEKIPFKFNNIKITYLVPNEDGVEYQYKLENFSEGWSNWNTKNIAEFLGLKEGDYTLLVKAKKGNVIYGIQKFNFNIKSPWYRTFWSYLLYVVLSVGMIYFLKKYQENKLKTQKMELLKKEQNSLREQAEKHRQEMFLEKQRQLEIEKNHLKEEIKNKTIELATKAKDDEDKNRILQTIGEKIVEIEQNPNISKIRLGEIRRMLKTYLEIEDHTFEIQMDELHQEFFKAMKKKFPHLSIYDLRLCAYLKIGLNSKEMSEILQVLPSSINVSRSRLRKKLGLAPEDDLYEFLNGI